MVLSFCKFNLISSLRLVFVLLFTLAFSEKVEAQCSVLISPLSVPNACFISETPVLWTDLVNVTVSGSDISRPSGNNWGGSGAASINQLVDDMYVYTVVGETNKNRMIGMSSTNTNAHFNTIDFAIYLMNNATIQIRESGTSIGSFGAYTIGDTIKVAIESGLINYYRNAELLYTSLITPSLPLIVDVSLYSNGSTLREVNIGGYLENTFNCVAINVGANPGFQWKLNGVNVGTNSAIYVNNSFANNDEVLCEVQPDIGSCGGAIVSSNLLTVTERIHPIMNAVINPFHVTNSCYTSETPVIWTDLVNVAVNGNHISRPSGNGWGSSGAASLNQLTDDMYMYTVVAETNKQRMVGLSSANANANFNTIDFAIYLRNNGTIQVRESGTSKGDFGSYVSGDTLKVYIKSGVIYYYRNTDLLYTSSLSPSLPLIVDASLQTNGATLQAVSIGGYVENTFNCVATNAGDNPTYQWKLNGLNVGSNSANYVNNSLAQNDVISCQITPDIIGCNGSIVNSNTLNIDLDLSLDMEAVINPVYGTSSCYTAETSVVWTDLVNIAVSGNDISRPSGSGWGNCGAASLNQLTDNMYMYTVASETNKQRMIGLSSTNMNAHYNTIDFAIYLRNNGTLQVRELGTSKGDFGSYVNGDTLKVAIESGVIYYYRDSDLLYTSLISPTFPLLVDASLQTNGSTLTEVTVGGYMESTFNCVATNVGTNPTYQWKLNGGNVGTTGNSYVNNSLADNDLITCDITPDIDNCNGSTLNANSVHIGLNLHPDMKAIVSPVFVTNSCYTAEETVVWTDLVNVTLNGNDITRSSGNSWGGSGAASVNQLSDDMYMYTIVNETNKQRMVGLSSTNANAHYNTIDFAIYLRNNGIVQVRESGVSKGDFGSYYNGDTLKVSVESSVIYYYRNSDLLYTSSNTPSLPLQVDASLYKNGSTLKEVSIGGSVENTFNCLTNNVGISPSFQWKLNGVDVGNDNSTYLNNDLVDNDVISCEVIPDIINCANSPVHSNIISLNETIHPMINAGVSLVSGTGSCDTYRAETSVVWTDLVNATVIGSDVSRPSGNGWGSSGAASVNQITDNMYMYTVAGETNKYRMVGLSSANTNAHYNTIDFAIYLLNNGTIQVRESGSSKGGFGPYVNDDTLMVAVESGIINYYRNSDLIYTSLVSPSLPLLVDASLYSSGATLQEVNIGGYVENGFNCLANNVGVNPSYQWKLNGGDVGSNSTVYTNPNLSNSDIIYCEVTPDIINCGASAVNTLTWTIKDNEVKNTFWNGDVNADWNNSVNWSLGVPDSSKNAIIQTGGVNAPILNTDGSCRDLIINAGGGFEISSTNQLSLYGNWINEGDFTANESTVLFTSYCSLTSSKIQNSSAQTFASIAIDNNVDLTIIGSEVSLRGQIAIINGALETNDSLRIISDAISTGRVAEISGTGITGEIVMERYIDAGETFWRYFGSAVQGATLSQFNDDFTTSGYLGSLYENFGWVSAYNYNEALGPGLGYQEAVFGGQEMAAGEGWQIWCGDTITGTQPFTWDLRGVPNQGDINLPVTYTNSGTLTEDGFCLVANPYPSAIDWDDADWVKTNMANATYIQNPDNQLYATYVSGASTNGGSQFIASQQGFWVQAFATSPVLKATEGVKSSVDQTFLKSNSIFSPGMTITLQGSEEFDQAVLRHIESANDNFEYEYDANKWWGGWGDYPQISLINQQERDLTVYSFDKGFQEWIIPLRAVVFESGLYNIEFENLGELDVPCLFLEDTYTSQMYQVFEGAAYAFDMSDTSFAPRFLLHLGSDYESTSFNASCYGDNDGAISLDLNLDQDVDFTLTSSSTSQALQANGDPLIISDLVSGVYEVSIAALTDVCSQSTFNFVINHPPQLEVSPTIVDEINKGDAEISLEVTGGTAPYSYLWSNGETSSSITNLIQGNYVVQIFDANDCYMHEQFTIENVLSLVRETNQQISFVLIEEENTIIISGLSSSDNYDVALYDVSGKSIKRFDKISGKTSCQIKYEQLPKGVYILNLIGTSSTFKFKN
jgi:hypothetical protein